MAQLFFAYDGQDRDIARRLEEKLSTKGHNSVWCVDELVAGRGWGELMPRRLANADAVVAIITPNSERSTSVWCEIGAARVLANSEKHTALLPVVINLDKIPKYTEDMLVLQVDNKKEQDELTDTELEKLVEKIDTAIQAHLIAVETDAARTSSPKIFISHRHKDQDIARALVETIETQFYVKHNEIRCTSVQPYRLPFGKNTGERLRDEIKNAQVVLGILSPDTSESTYVMFELGAAWSQRIYTCPLLSKGAEYSHIPGPIFDLAPARLWVTSDCHQLLDNLGAEIDLKANKEKQGAVSEKINNLTKVAKMLPEVEHVE